MTDAETRGFVNSELSDLTLGAAEEPLNFVDVAVEWLHRWAQRYNVPASLEKPAYCCFILCDRVAQVARAQAGFSLQRSFRDDTPQDILGRVHLCSPTLQSVFSKDMIAASIDQVEDEIERLGLKSNAIVIFNAANKQALWRVTAAADLTTIQVGGDLGDQLRSEDFDKELDRFHISYTATPSGFAMPWKSPGKLLTKDNLEGEIRNWLCVVLRLKYKNSLLVEFESSEPTGRADLKVFFILERISYFLELKVLRAYKRSGNGRKKVSQAASTKWGKEGITQAYSYLLANNQVGVAYACCYDARGNNDEIAELVKYAEKMNVRYRRYFMFQSPSDFRKSLIT